MRFLDDGPDIPEALIREHLAGNVAFIVGAGLSANAGFPLFRGLVEQTYSALGIDFPLCRPQDHPGEAEACRNDQWDRVLGMLEARLGDVNPLRPHHGSKVRMAVARILNSKGRDTTSHGHLLSLSAVKFAEPRIITTNFDTLFERAWRNATASPLRSVAGSGMPAVGSPEFSGVMHLHGRLADPEVPVESSDLILTSGDFGEAYLRSGWAARFVYDLLRRFTVVFIGYSADDPPIRYMLEAAYAGRYRFPDVKSAYAFVGAKAGEENAEIDKWKGKGPKALLYRVSGDDHRVLHETLAAWASCMQDPFEWASAEIQTRTSLSYAASRKDDQHKVQFLVQTMSDARTLSRHALTSGHYDWLQCLVDVYAADDRAVALPTFAQHAVRWFEDRAEDAATIRWLVGWKNERLRGVVAEVMAWLARRGDLKSPYREFWRAFVACTERPPAIDLRYLPGRWSPQDGFDSMGVALAVDGIRPRLRLRELYREPSIGAGPVTLSDLCRPEIHCQNAAAVEEILKTLPADILSQKRMLEAADRALVEVCEKARDVGWFDDFGRSSHDPRFVHEPDETDLATFLADEHEEAGWIRNPPDAFDSTFAPISRVMTSCWRLIAADDPSFAANVARTWLRRDFLIFRRMAVWAATIDPTTLSADVESMLSRMERREFWLAGRNPEFVRFWCSRWSSMSTTTRDAIEEIILAGPDLPNSPVDEARSLQDRGAHMELTRIVSWPRNQISQRAAEARSEIAGRASGLPDRLSITDLLVSISWSGFGRFGNTGALAGVGADELLEKVTSIERDDPMNQGQLWERLCQEDPIRAWESLELGAKSGDWPVQRWASFLSFGALSADPPGPEILALLGRLAQMPDDAIAGILPYVTSYLRDAAEKAPLTDVRSLLLETYDRLIETVAGLPTDADEDSTDLMFKGLNRPAGQIAGGLLWVLDRGEDDADSVEVMRRLDRLFGWPPQPRQLALVILLRRLGWFFHFHHQWAVDHLFPTLTAGTPDSIRLLGYWAQFDQNYGRSLFAAMKGGIELALASTSSDAESMKALALVVTRAAFAVIDGNADIGVSKTDVRRMLTRCKGEALSDAAWVVAHQVAKEDAWTKWVQPFFSDLWPIDADTRSPDVTRVLAMIPTACGSFLPAAVNALSQFIVPSPTDSIFFGLDLHDDDHRALVQRFPDAVLQLAEEVVDLEAGVPQDLTEFLDAVGRASPALRSHWRYRRLKTAIRGR